ncbi:hypothetical protein I5M27_17565 [Adhaeribacter sp. BT258]|uniref:Uncharacterized protein n=1 Tax=Adhaeribacter terrigena TaxID=2793070 RepID=A0ABS1C621_9BACT|nr:hypothetical protein [Adhaeribacter terrigena]MBK0404804.1 hypothetical protein [Adhaeribacter terrigena]
MRKKATKIFIPPVVGLILSIIAWQLEVTTVEYFYPPFDGAFFFQPFDFSVFWPLYLLFLVGSFLFQYFFILKLWSLNRRTNSFFKLWHLVGGFCIGFGLYYGFTSTLNNSNFLELLYNITIGVILAVVYWLGNLTSLAVIDKKKNLSQQGA